MECDHLCSGISESRKIGIVGAEDRSVLLLPSMHHIEELLVGEVSNVERWVLGDEKITPQEARG